MASHGPLSQAAGQSIGFERTQAGAGPSQQQQQHRHQRQQQQHQQQHQQQPRQQLGRPRASIPDPPPPSSPNLHGNARNARPDNGSGTMSQHSRPQFQQAREQQPHQHHELRRLPQQIAQVQVKQSSQRDVPVTARPSYLLQEEHQLGLEQQRSQQRQQQAQQQGQRQEQRQGQQQPGPRQQGEHLGKRKEPGGAEASVSTPTGTSQAFRNAHERLQASVTKACALLGANQEAQVPADTKACYDFLGTAPPFISSAEDWNAKMQELADIAASSAPLQLQLDAAIEEQDKHLNGMEFEAAQELRESLAEAYRRDTEAFASARRLAVGARLAQLVAEAQAASNTQFAQSATKTLSKQSERV